MTETTSKYISNPTDDFDFSHVVLKPPTSISGGGFFSKFTNSGENFYIKTPKCITKQGFQGGGKRIFCDLLFSNTDDDEFARWMEGLVTHSQRILAKKSVQWFQDEMTEEDLEEMMISPIKTSRAGKYLVRAVVGGDPPLKIYNELGHEIALDGGGLPENAQIITLLEIHGIKCSLKSFQFEFFIKQIMVVAKNNILNSCVLATVPPISVDNQLNVASLGGIEGLSPLKNPTEISALSTLENSPLSDNLGGETPKSVKEEEENDATEKELLLAIKPIEKTTAKEDAG
jgi:hypothetical protein